MARSRIAQNNTGAPSSQLHQWHTGTDESCKRKRGAKPEAVNIHDRCEKIKEEIIEKDRSIPAQKLTFPNTAQSTLKYMELCSLQHGIHTGRAAYRSDTLRPAVAPSQP